jgi:tRNA uridine 5-carboxymethylaminomethyl modification enzyme
MNTDFDVLIIGGGHAGCEAALAAARLGLRAGLAALSLDSIALMPCNPNIGGTSKGHLVREVDALGGEMARNIDRTYIQSRMLNTAKGPAVYSLRAQADKARYAREMRRVLENTPGLALRQTEIVDLLVEQGRLAGAVAASGRVYRCGAAVVCAGTYLNARCLCGEQVTPCGPGGLRPALGLSAALARLGLGLRRFKTGTPARVDSRSVDFSKLQPQPGDDPPTPFSFENTAQGIRRRQIPCYLTYTTPETHRLIRENLHRSPLYAGVIEGVGARYCPSIEDKVVRFPQKDRHPVFIEPEGEDTCELYVSGMSTSLPEDVQEALYRTLPGLEHCRVLRNGYAIEYDCLDPTGLTLGLMVKHLPGLFAAGQVNGSSGYEEAAAQGLLAGINAALYVQGKAPFVLDRSQGYMGVLVDDLVTKGTGEPYRMMTSRAEYRLLLRQDNADLRLTPLGYALGLVRRERYEAVLAKEAAVAAEVARVNSLVVAPSPAVNDFLRGRGSAPLVSGARLADLIKRPELDYGALAPVDPGRPPLPEAAALQVSIQIKYEGYIARQCQQVAQFKKLEAQRLPPGLDYNAMATLRLEARQKLTAAQPQNLGQASRLPGVSPADISALTVLLMKNRSV